MATALETVQQIYAAFGRGRRSLCVDMKKPEGLALVRRLVPLSVAVLVLLRSASGRNLVYAAMALCQSANMLMSAAEIALEFGLPPPLLRWGMPLHMAFDLLTAAAMVNATCLHPRRLPGSGWIALAAWGVAFALVAAFNWSLGNLVSKRAGCVNMVAYVVWGSLFSVLPLAALSLAVEGPARIGDALAAAGPGVWAAVVWQAVGNTLFGYAAWAWLLARHPAATIVPMALLVPVFGFATAAWWLGEALPAWKLGAAALIMGGLALNLLGPQLLALLKRR